MILLISHYIKTLNNCKHSDKTDDSTLNLLKLDAIEHTQSAMPLKLDAIEPTQSPILKVPKNMDYYNFGTQTGFPE